MGVTNRESGTRVDEIAAGIYRIHTPVKDLPGGFSFNQYLVRDEAPLLFHTGPRGMAPLVMEAIGSVMPIGKLRWIGFSHFENDECGGLNAILARATEAQPLCGKINALVNGDAFDRPARALGDGEELVLGERKVRWIDAPHLPHAWECGFLMEQTTRTLLCGDLFTQPGAEAPAVTNADILGPSEAFRAQLDYYSHTQNARALIERLAATEPTTLACMHGSAWQGDGAALLRALGEALAGERG
ncbi:MAG TPA: MBL fold metallo-hydrolase [Polyangia bacterium]|jgi:flavorubredoxin